MAFFTPIIQTSVHGRRLGITSTGGIIVDQKGTKYGSVLASSAGAMAMSSALQVQGYSGTEISSTVASTFTAWGLSILGSGTATAITMEIAAPIAGVEKVIVLDTSASALSLGGPTTDIVFQSTVAGAAGSTLLLAAAAPLAGKTAIRLVGYSTARWLVTGSTNNIVIG